jgi:tetratricopeptide (TPR) repeat protein
MPKSAILLFGLLLAFQPLPVSAHDPLSAAPSIFQEPTPQGVVIKDPAEYNAFLNALNDADRSRRALLWEEFLRAYPRSVARVEALEYLLGAYWQIPNLEKAEATADKILALNREHLRALVVAAGTKHKRARTLDSSQKAALAQEARALAERGLIEMERVRRPEGMPVQEWDKARANMEAVLCGAAGFGALQEKEFVTARDYYLRADLTDVENLAELAYAELQTTPLDVNGFWHIARAQIIAKAQKTETLVRQIESYGKTEYQRYHGSHDGWDEVLRQARISEELPHGFTVSRYYPPAPQPTIRPQPTLTTQSNTQPQSKIQSQSPRFHPGADVAPPNGDDKTASRGTPCDAPAAAMPRTEHATPGGVPASTTSFGSDSRAHGVPSSVSSPVNGQSHGVPASVTSPGTDCMLNGVAAGIDSVSEDEAHGVPASVTSPVDGQSHGVPASVTSPVEGQPHGVPASITSIGVDGSLHGIPASTLLPAVEPPLLLVVFGDLDSPEVEVMAVPVFGAWRQMTQPRPASQKRASLQRRPSRRATERKPSAAAAMAQK